MPSGQRAGGPPTILPARDLQYQFIRASGPGGQNVNKVASAVQLRFDLAGTQALPEDVKARLRALAGSRVTADGALLIAARSHRTQEANRRDALARLMQLIARARVVPKTRRPTAPTFAARRRRADDKRRRQQTKRLRARVADD